MALGNKMLAMDLGFTIKQQLSQFLDSGILDDQESMELSLEQRNGLARTNARLLPLIRDLANELKIAAPMVPFGTGFAEIPMIYHTTSEGMSVYVFWPCFEGYGSNSSEIRPAFISDGFSTQLNESEENLFCYLASNFSDQDQEELFRKILKFLETNFSSPNGSGTSRISKCVKAFCEEMDLIINAEARE